MKTFRIKAAFLDPSPQYNAFLAINAESLSPTATNLVLRKAGLNILRELIENKWQPKEDFLYQHQTTSACLKQEADELLNRLLPLYENFPDNF